MELPAPARLPEGVIIVLGSQSLELRDLPSAIVAQLRGSGHTLRMEPLGPADVAIMLRDAAIAPPLTDDEIAEVYRLSAGHPLAVNYLINRLRHRGDTQTVAEVLEDAGRFSSRVTDQYLEHWRQIQDDFALVRLLALLSRTRGAIRLAWVRTWAEPAALHTLTQRFGHYFRRAPESWQFFHNSFRVFLVAETREVPSLPPEPTLYRALADACAATEDGPLSERLDELFYRAHALQPERVLALAQPDEWRAQFFLGRAVATIRADLREAILAAVTLRDVTMLMRLWLADAEFRAREYYTEHLAMGELTARLGDPVAGAQWVAHESALLVDKESALHTAAALASSGERATAQQIFGLAEPLRWISGPQPIPADELRDVYGELAVWAGVAPTFRSEAALVDAISRIHVAHARDRDAHMDHPDTVTDGEAAGDLDNAPDVAIEGNADPRDHSAAHGPRHARESAVLRIDLDASLDVQLSLLREAARALDIEARFDAAEGLVRAFLAHAATAAPLVAGDVSHMWLELARSAAVAGAPVVAERRLAEAERLLLLEGPQRAASERSALLHAEMCARIRGDLAPAQAYLAATVPPSVVSAREVASSDSGLRGFLPFFQHYRLAFAVGESRSMREIVPDSEFAQSRQLLAFHRALLVMARLAGQAWAQLPQSPGTVATDVKGVLRVLFADRDDMRDLGAYRVTSAREETLTLLIRIVAAHGDDVRDRALAAFDEEKRHAEPSDACTPELWRAVLRTFVEVGSPPGLIVPLLRELEPDGYSAGQLESELSEASAQARLWLDLGEPGRARQTIARALTATLSVEEKDNQLLDWIAWSADASTAAPEELPQRFATMATAVLASTGTSENRYAAAELLRRAGAIDEAAGVTLLHWCLEHRLLEWSDAWLALLDGVVTGHPGTAPKAALLYAFVVLPLDAAARGSWLRTLRGALSRDASSPLAVPADRLLRAALAVELPASARRRWLGAPASHDEAPAWAASFFTADVADGDDAASEMADGMPDTTDDRLSDGALTAAVTALSSVEAVERLLTRLRGETYRVTWTTALAPLIDRLDVDALGRLAASLPARSDLVAARTRIALRLAALGEASAGQSLALEILRSTEPSGWNSQYDGGSRVVALRALSDLDAPAAREQAWRLLERDWRADRVTALTFARSARALFPVLVTEVAVGAIADVVEAHVRVLVAHAGSVAAPTIASSTDPSAVHPASRDLWSAGAALLEHPVSALRAGAVRVLAAALVAHDADVGAVVQRLLESGDGARSSALLLVLEGAALENVETIRDFVPALRNARAVLDFRSRRRINALLVSVGEHDGPAPPSLILPPLPAAYQVVQSHAIPAREIAPRGRDGFLPDAVSAAEVVAAFRDLIALAARLADVHRDALARDVVNRLASWNAAATSAAETSLRDHLSALGLQVPFLRPRQQVVERALMESLAVLEDCGRFDHDAVARLASEVDDGDPAFVLRHPSSRPSSIRPLSERQVNDGSRRPRYPSDDWTQRVSLDGFSETQSAAGLAGERAQGQVESLETVIAEVSVIRWGTRDDAAEVRCRVRQTASEAPAVRGRRRLDRPIDDEAHGDPWLAAITLMEPWATTWQQALIEDYTRLTARRTLVVATWTPRFVLPLDGWLAFNPLVARALGWTLDDSGLFRWVDAEGRVMVDSVRWQDGSRWLRRHSGDNEVGYGWRVVASLAGWQAITAFTSAQVEWRHAQRSAARQPSVAEVEIVVSTWQD